MVRGRLSPATVAEAQLVHDGIASYGEAGASALGDVAHQVFLGVDDWHEFLAIDIWGDATNIEALYTDPAFAEAFTTLYEGTPTLQVYASTDWYQW